MTSLIYMKEEIIEYMEDFGSFETTKRPTVFLNKPQLYKNEMKQFFWIYLKLNTGTSQDQLLDELNPTCGLTKLAANH